MIPFTSSLLENQSPWLSSHIENLIETDLKAAEHFFAENKKNGHMYAEVTPFGNRVVRVDGFEGAVKISKLAAFLTNAALNAVLMESDAEERLAGLEIVKQVRQLNAKTRRELKTQNIFTRFAAQNWISDSNTKRLETPEFYFRTYNRAQFKKDFPVPPKTTQEGISTFDHMKDFDPTARDFPTRYLDVHTKQIVTRKDSKLADKENLMPISELRSFKRQVFTVKTKDINTQLKKAKQAVAKALEIISAVAPQAA